MKRKFLVSAAAAAIILATLPVLSAEETVKVKNTLSADDIQYNTNTGDSHATGHVVITREDAILRGDSAVGNTDREVMTLLGNVDGTFPEEEVLLKCLRVTWTGDKTKKTDGTVEAWDKVHLTKGADDRLDADYVKWELGTENYRAKGHVDGIFDKKILKSDDATRIGDKFYAHNVRRYEDTVEKYAISTREAEGRIAKDPKTGNDVLSELVADGNVVIDYIDKENNKVKITGDKAVYAKARGTVVISGNTKAVRSDGKVVTADTMTVHEDTRIVEAHGHSHVEIITNAKKDNKTDKNKDKKEAKENKEKKKSKSLITDEPVSGDVVSQDKKPEYNKPEMSESEKSWIEQ